MWQQKRINANLGGTCTGIVSWSAEQTVLLLMVLVRLLLKYYIQLSNAQCQEDTGRNNFNPDLNELLIEQ